MIEHALFLIKTHWNVFWEYWTPVIMVSIGIIVFFLEAFGGMKAEYGRYNKKNKGFSAPIAWLIQECPAFFVPLFLILYQGAKIYDNSNKINTNLLLLLFFMMHYFNRYNLKNILRYYDIFL